MKQEARFPAFMERFRQLQGDRSNTEFAEFLGMSRQTVGFYCNGDRIPDALGLRQIAQRCQVSADWLLGLSGEPTRDPQLQMVCDYTGLSAQAVETVKGIKGKHPHTEVHNFLLSDKGFMMALINYLASFSFQRLKEKPYCYIPVLPGKLYPYMDDIFFSRVILALQDVRNQFRAQYGQDETFILQTLFGFLEKNADFDACRRAMKERDTPDEFDEEEENEVELIKLDHLAWDENVTQEEKEDLVWQEMAQREEAIAAFMEKMKDVT